MTTTHLQLPELTASQSQKHVTHNEALEHLDVIVQLAVLDKDLSTPPGSPTTGDRYIVGASATDDWTGKENEIAYYDGDGWVFKTPNDGWFCWVDDESEIYFYNAGWSALGDVLGADYMPLAGGTFTGDVALEEASPSIRFGDTDINGDTLLQTNGVNFQISVDYNNVDANSTFQVLIDGSTELEVNEHGLGIGGASADATNGFSFYGTNLLLNSGGSIDLKYNKNASGDDASMTFQQGFSTYALMGLLANNDFTLKVGTSFTTALVANNSDGTVSFPEGVRHDALQAYKESSQTLTGTGTWDTVTSYDGTHIAASGNLSWTASTGDAYVGKAGRFLISYAASTEITAGDARSDSLARIEKYNGSSWVAVEGSTQRMYNRTTGRGGSNASWTGILDLGASDGIRLAVTVETGTDTIVLDYASLTVNRM